MAKNERFAYWAEVVTQRFVPLECDSPDRASFHGSIRHRQIGLIGISDVRASAMRALLAVRRREVIEAPGDTWLLYSAAGIIEVGAGADRSK